ncbi:radical SAM protein [Sphingorhabdus sp. Alg239-R122]|uniref:radical SAM protein n=1 Tax=Sphingorhabdus sp. Alg239-R122 TaxID=2305989 RepID=UPI0013D95C96|nr:radical SAM protein [Sphingorhabdus sp. Alg239-R122]
MLIEKNIHGRAILTHRELEEIRHTADRSMLLFITDRCPVGCAHCSVDSRIDSPKITDFDLFERIVSWIAKKERLEVVAISGGEPFVEKRALLHASARFRDANKKIVVFTSGVWASAKRIPDWIDTVLGRVDTVYLSTDAFHQDAVDETAFAQAAQTVVSSNCWLIIQALDQGEGEQKAVTLLQRALGNDYRRFAEINITRPLDNGRGANVFHVPKRLSPEDIAPCHLIRNPMIRYDGRVSACCNEDVIMGLGPDQLRCSGNEDVQFDQAIADFNSNPMLNVVGGIGLGLLTQHPAFSALTDGRIASTCDLCWKALDMSKTVSRDDPLLNILAALPGKGEGQ